MNDGHLIWDTAYREGFCVITKLRGFEENWLLLQGVDLAGKWPEGVTFSMSPRYPKDINLSDNLFGGSYRVVSKALKELLTVSAGKSRIEFLPVSILNHKGRIASKEYFIMNPLDAIDCIDVEKSGVTWNAMDQTEISHCKKLVLKEDAIPPELAMFRSKLMLSTILLRREIADKLSTEELTGLFFVEP